MRVGVGKGRPALIESGRVFLAAAKTGISAEPGGCGVEVFFGASKGAIFPCEGRVGGSGGETFCDEDERLIVGLNEPRGGMVGRLGAAPV